MKIEILIEAGFFSRRESSQSLEIYYILQETPLLISHGSFRIPIWSWGFLQY